MPNRGDRNDLWQEMMQLPAVPGEAAQEYERKAEQLIRFVDETLLARDDLSRLIGRNPLKVMLDNHFNHFQFMVNIFRFNQFGLLLQNIPWVYRSYINRGFSPDYFPIVLGAWSQAVERYLEKDTGSSIREVYRWMIDRHEQLLHLAVSGEERQSPSEPDGWGECRDVFLDALLRGDHRACLNIARETVRKPVDLVDFYIKVIQSALYEVGSRWEQGTLSVAMEHLASAIVSRVMAFLYPQFMPLMHSRGPALVTAAPNEFHEIGARMVADCLEMDGWDIHYLGANVPAADLHTLLHQLRPGFLAISACMPFNLDRAIDLITEIKLEAELKDIPVILGGQLFLKHPGLWQLTGADYFAADCRQAVTVARQIRGDKRGNFE